MPRAKRGERRERGSGTIVRRGGRFYLQLRIGRKPEARSYVRLILGPDGERARSIETAREYAPALAKALRAEATSNVSGIPVAGLAQAYEQYLPGYGKRRGEPHPDATRGCPLAPRTVLTNRETIGRFTRWMAGRYPGIKVLEAVGKVHALGYMTSLDNPSPATYNRVLAALKHVFAVVPVTANPFAGLTAKSAATIRHFASGKRAFTVAELEVLQARATGWMRPAMFIGFHSGLRLGDVVTLRWSEVDGEGYIQRTQRKSGKDVPLYVPEVLAELDRWRQEQGPKANSEYVFPDMARAYLGIGRKPATCLPAKLFAKFLRDVCGFKTTNDAGKTILGFHSLRASNATYGRRAGETVAEVQKRLAHTSGQTTAGYIQLSAADQRRELRETHRPLLLPGAATDAERSDLADRDAMAALARTLPIAEVRRLLASARV